MRAITKGAEPPSLTSHRQTRHCDYDNYADKMALRRALVTEQRGVCCYCMGRIRSEPDTMKVEHWRSQSRHASEQLNFGNLLAACQGGEGQPQRLQHCDTRKADRDLQWNPADPVHHIETRLRYELDGSIRSDESDFNVQLEDVLNLNLPRLMNSRKGVLDAILRWWQLEKERTRGIVPRARFEREHARCTRGRGELAPFCQVAVWWLERRLSVTSA